MREPGDLRPLAEGVHLAAEPGQRLPEFHAEAAEPHHRQPAGQVRLFEQRVTRQQVLAVGLPGGRYTRTAASSQDDLLRLDDLLADLQPVRTEQPGLAAEEAFPQVADGLGRAGGEAVAQSAHMRHHRRQVGPQRLSAEDAAARHVVAAVVVGGHDQQRLGGHATHARAGGAERSAIDQQEVVRHPADGFHRREPGAAGADDGDAYAADGHACSLRLP